jgi:hypothetical protein
VVLVSGVAMKRFMPTFFERVQEMIMNVARQMGA